MLRTFKYLRVGVSPRSFDTREIRVLLPKIHTFVNSRSGKALLARHHLDRHLQRFERLPGIAIWRRPPPSKRFSFERERARQSFFFYSRPGFLAHGHVVAPIAHCPPAVFISWNGGSRKFPGLTLNVLKPILWTCTGLERKVCVRSLSWMNYTRSISWEWNFTNF